MYQWKQKQDCDGFKGKLTTPSIVRYLHWFRHAWLFTLQTVKCVAYSYYPWNLWNYALLLYFFSVKVCILNEMFQHNHWEALWMEMLYLIRADGISILCVYQLYYVLPLHTKYFVAWPVVWNLSNRINECVHITAPCHSTFIAHYMTLITNRHNFCAHFCMAAYLCIPINKHLKMSETGG